MEGGGEGRGGKGCARVKRGRRCVCERERGGKERSGSREKKKEAIKKNEVNSLLIR